jgi:hypothetical protein
MPALHGASTITLVQEKRRHERVGFRVPVTCTRQGGPEVQGVIVDLSVGGVFIEAPSSPPFGASIVIHADLPGAPKLALAAVVRWTKPHGFGVQFGLLGAVETHALAAIVAKSRLSA